MTTDSVSTPAPTTPTKPEKLMRYAPVMLFGVALLIVLFSVIGSVPSIKEGIRGYVNLDTSIQNKLCSDTLPTILGCIYVFMFAAFVWVLFGWSVTREKK